MRELRLQVYRTYERDCIAVKHIWLSPEQYDGDGKHLAYATIDTLAGMVLVLPPVNGQTSEPVTPAPPYTPPPSPTGLFYFAQKSGYPVLTDH